MSSVAESHSVTTAVRAPSGLLAPAEERYRSDSLRGGVLWIVLLGLMLAGVVAVNVFVLRLNVQYDELGRQRAELQAEVATLQAQLSSASANVRIETEAQEKLGLELAPLELTTHVRLVKGQK
jgi:cell division protein FtsL